MVDVIQDQVQDVHHHDQVQVEDETVNDNDIVVIGGCVMDLISYVSRFPQPGETVIGLEFKTGFGGKGANQCVMAARLGARAAIIGKVGNDVYGQNYLENFKNNGVNTSNVTISEAITGVASITVDRTTGQNSIVYVAGANGLLTQTDVDKAAGLITSAKVLVCQLEVPLDVTLSAMKLARKHGVCTILNPAPAQMFLEDDLFNMSDIFCLNETEASTLTGCPVRNTEEAVQAASALLGKGCRSVIVTLGPNGCVFAAADAPPLHLETTSVTAIDTTGAGDAFVGSLAYHCARSSHLKMVEKIKCAMHIATMSVQKEGTQTSFPSHKDVIYS